MQVIVELGRSAGPIPISKTRIQKPKKLKKSKKPRPGNPESRPSI